MKKRGFRFLREAVSEARYQLTKLLHLWRRDRRFRLLVYGPLACLVVIGAEFLVPVLPGVQSSLRHFVYSVILWSFLAWAGLYVLPWLYRKITKDENRVDKIAIALMMPAILTITACFIWIAVSEINPPMATFVWVLWLAIVVSAPALVVAILLWTVTILWGIAGWLWENGCYLAVRFYHRYLRRLSLYWRKPRTPYDPRLSL